MATDIPPHNLREVVKACVALLDDPDLSTRKIMAHIKGPDLPTGAEIVSPRDELVRCTRRGSGSFKARATYEIEDGEIVIDALPFQVSGSQGAGADRRPDAAEEAAHGRGPARRVGSRESHPAGDRAEVQPRRHPGADGALFATTDLERNYRVNLNVIALDGRPRVMGLKELLLEWLEFRKTTVTPAAEAIGSTKLNARLHILDGMLIAYLESRRGDPHRAHRGSAEAGADQALQALRRAGRGHSRDQAAPPGAARGDEDPRRAEGARRGARRDRKDT